MGALYRSAAAETAGIRAAPVNDGPIGAEHGKMAAPSERSRANHGDLMLRPAGRGLRQTWVGPATRSPTASYRDVRLSRRRSQALRTSSVGTLEPIARSKSEPHRRRG
jgi:hypothetical protein